MQIARRRANAVAAAVPAVVKARKQAAPRAKAGYV
jgi:hypothetical protein